jgi:crotonyl-CoA reductase
MDQIREAILSGDRTEQTYAGIEVPKTYRAATVHKDEALMFEGLASRDKDPRKSLHVEQVPTPELAPGEALVAVMASAINYNTVWTSIFEPVSTFGFLERYGRTSSSPSATTCPTTSSAPTSRASSCAPGSGSDQVEARHRGRRALPVRRARGRRRPRRHDDGPAAADLGLRDQLRRSGRARDRQGQPADAQAHHLSWEEAASPGLVNSTAYRQLISRNGAGMKLGDRVLIWGASGGLGSYATQMALAGGATPICVVSSPEKAEICRAMGAELIIDRSAEGYRFWNEDGTKQNPKEWQRLGKKIRELTGGPRRRHRLRAPRPRDLRRQRLRRPQGRHDRHLRVDLGLHARVRQPLPVDEPQAHHLLPLRELPRGVGGQRAHRPRPDPPDPEPTYRLEDVGQAALDVHRNLHQGKVGVLTLAPEEGLGVSNPEKRARFESEINRFRNA